MDQDHDTVGISQSQIVRESRQGRQADRGWEKWLEMQRPPSGRDAKGQKNRLSQRQQSRGQVRGCNLEVGPEAEGEGQRQGQLIPANARLGTHQTAQFLAISAGVDKGRPAGQESKLPPGTLKPSAIPMVS